MHKSCLSGPLLEKLGKHACVNSSISSRCLATPEIFGQHPL